MAYVRAARPATWLTGGLLVLGASSALLGIAHATVQNRLSRVIAYSSIENTGLIVVGFGVALTGAGIGDRRLVAAGLLAATLQVVTHTLAKSLLFTSSARIEAATGADDLEELRGRARRTPWSGFGLAVGSLTLAGLPPTAGFVSEWFLLESLMQQFRVLVETYSYRPALGVFTSVVTAAKRLQSGRLDAYLLYMLIALIAVIAVATALA